MDDADKDEAIATGDDSASRRAQRRPDLVESLRDLALLRDRDELTEAEFQQAKAKVVDSRRGDRP